MYIYLDISSVFTKNHSAHPTRLHTHTHTDTNGTRDPPPPRHPHALASTLAFPGRSISSCWRGSPGGGGPSARISGRSGS